MQRYVADTQCLLWHMGDRRRLSKTVERIFTSAEEGRAQILVPSIFLAQRQKIKENVLNRLLVIAEQPDANFYVTPLNMAVIQALRSFGPAAVPELSDRIIAATAVALKLPLLTTDMAIAASGLVSTIG